MSQFSPELNAARNRVERERNAEALFKARETAVFQEQRQVNAELRNIRAQIQNPNVPDSEKNALTARGVELESQYNRLEQQGQQLTQQVQEAQAELRAAQAELASLEQQSPSNDGAVSAGTTSAEAARARDDSATTQNPSPPPETLAPEGRIEKTAPTPPTNAEKFQPAGSVGDQVAVPPINGTAAPVSTPPQTQASGDDVAGPPSTASNPTQAAIDRKFGGAIQPRPNVLDQYASYTYTLSIYLMSPEDYQRLLENNKKYVAGFQLLMQSGGAPSSTGLAVDPNQQDGPLPTNAPSLTQGRNQYFPEDFYIDSLKFKEYVPGKGTRSAHGMGELEFRIVEPNGITLFERLYKAVQQYVTVGGGASGSPENYAAQNYLLVIRFYGYDANGNLVAPLTRDPVGTTDRNAISEKFIPFRFTGIKFRIANRLTEYDCTAVTVQNDILTGQGRGTIPYNIEIKGSTLQEALVGRPTSAGQTQTTAAPPKADAAPKNSTNVSFVDALNNFATKFANEKGFEFPDVYRIVIIDPEIQNAKLRPPGQVDKSATPMTKPQTAAQAKDGFKQNMANASQNRSATAGLSIAQFLDQMVRNSTYIYDQQTKIKDPTTGATVPQGSASTPAWFRIGLQAKPLKYDRIRNDFAYEMTYQISMYKVSQIKSDYFPQGRFVGTQKKYNYWFTGQNTSVLRYEQDFNYLFYLTVNTEQTIIDRGSTTSYREFEKRAFAPNSPESAQGTKNNASEAGANAADYLYSPGDLAEVRLEILGDPAWISQGETWAGVGSESITDAAQVAFLPDGTINFETQEALFEVAFNKPGDYDLATGVMKIPGRGS
jgi:hypothetical protein